MSSSETMSQGTDRDRLYEEYVASTDVEFAYVAELKEATGETTVALQSKLDAQAAESRRLWALYRMGEPTD